ncbi:MAG: LicD family protein [Oscillospiraceae bacterium]|nr:LicD family protein [Oscillospiraceae bacterium]
MEYNNEVNAHALSALQSRLLDMLGWYHRFCEENSLRYYVLGGTMLGAARHGGFIPWDDDVDVGMPRKDYQKFLRLCAGKRFGSYVVESADSSAREYLYGFSKVYDVSTTLVERAKLPVKRGVYLDLFPLDGICDSEQESIRRAKKLIMQYNFLLTRICAQRDGRSFYKSAAIFAAQLIPDFIIDNKSLMRRIDKKYAERPYDDYGYVANLYGNWGIREMMPRSVFGTPTLYSFENMKVFGAEKYDEYLTSLYGDWRKLPPEEKRVTHHDYEFCDLEQSYLEESRP